MAKPKKKTTGPKKKTTGAKSGVSISVADEHLDRLAEIADDLRSAGLEIDQVLKFTGTITGSMDPKRMEALKSARGVAAVEPEQVVHLPPPDAEIQ